MAQKVTAMDIRAATALAGQVENVAAFCRRHQISRQTFYKWRRRFGESGLAGLEERSRRPQRSPGQTAAAV
ncbi:MAG: IS66 family insertion sequence element accessory protein TnpA, partial [Candidatus Sericytochromatia bacterium]